MESGILLRLVGVITTFSLYLIHSIVKGENPTCVILWTNFNVGLYLDIYRPILFQIWHDDREH